VPLAGLKGALEAMASNETFGKTVVTL